MEMMVVVAIIGILAGISLPNMMTAIRNNRVRAVTLELLAKIRETRSQAISLARKIQFSVDAANKTYSVIIQKYTLYDPLRPEPSDKDILVEQEAEILASNVKFDPNDWLKLSGTPAPVEVNPGNFDLVFTPSGLVEMKDTPIGSIKLRGTHIAYGIVIYKAGQIDLFRVYD